MNQQNFYKTLDVSPDASVQDIRRSYRRLARKYHPDVNPGDTIAEERFKKISEAHDVLSDPKKREIYDTYGAYSENHQAQANAGGVGFDFSNFDFSNFGRSGFSDILSQLFPRERSATQRQGRDLECQISIGFEEALRGVQTRITYDRMEICQPCQGSGKAQGRQEKICPLCRGIGKITQLRGRTQFTKICHQCGGEGRTSKLCYSCRGQGRGKKSLSLDVKIPSGVQTGSRIRLVGKGDSGGQGASPGDLHIVATVASHPFFERKGDNIYCKVPVTVTEAALGAKIEVPTVDGRSVLRIPPGTQGGQKFRLREKGAPSLRAAKRGDQFVEVRVVVPKIADERSKELLRELALLNPDDPRNRLTQY